MSRSSIWPSGSGIAGSTIRCRSSESSPSRRAQEQQRRARGPCLRTAGRRILDRVVRLPARVATERLGQPPAELVRGLEHRAADHCALGLVAVAAQTPSDDRVVVRPHRADVVADRVVRPLGRRHGTDAPSREEIVAHEVLHAAARLVFVGDPAPQQVPDVRRPSDVDLALLAVERQREEAALGDPEVAVERAAFSSAACCSSAVAQPGSPQTSRASRAMRRLAS